MIAVCGKRKPCKQAKRRRDNLVLVVIDRCPFNVILPSFLPLANIEVKGRPLAAVNSLPFPICSLFIALSSSSTFSVYLPTVADWAKSRNINVLSQGPNHKILSTVVRVSRQEGRKTIENTHGKCPCLWKMKLKKVLLRNYEGLNLNNICLIIRLFVKVFQCVKTIKDSEPRQCFSQMNWNEILGQPLSSVSYSCWIVYWDHFSSSFLLFGTICVSDISIWGIINPMWQPQSISRSKSGLV